MAIDDIVERNQMNKVWRVVVMSAGALLVVDGMLRLFGGTSLLAIFS